MPDPKLPDDNVKEIAGGWMTERKGTDVPKFLKFAYIVIALGAIAYLFLFMNGEVNHSTRGFLVRQFNAATTSANGFMYVVAGMIVIFLIILVKFAFSKVHED